MKGCNVTIDGQKFFDQPVKNNIKTYDNIQKIKTGQRDDYTTGCLLDYNYFDNYHKMIVIATSVKNKYLTLIQKQCKYDNVFHH